MSLYGYKDGLEYFRKKEYEKAVKCFEAGVNMGDDASCTLMLGKCHELGLGVQKDLVLAKDNYKVALLKFGFMHRSDCEEILWLKDKLAQMKDIPEISEQRRFIDSIGWVKVVRCNVKTWSVRYNEDGVIVKISHSMPFCHGFNVAVDNDSKCNARWTCDGQTRFYDGYTLNTDFFKLNVKRSNMNDFQTVLKGDNCMVMFPKDADLNYLYIQEAIMNKVRDLLKKRAEIVLPHVLKEVSERIGVPYGNSRVNSRMTKTWATFDTRNKEITFSLECIQLPQESVESICVHELMHTFAHGHGSLFWRKFEEYGCRRLYDLDSKVDQDLKWQRLRLN